MNNKEKKENIKETKLVTWDKISFLNKKLDFRPREFYVLMSFRYLNISFALVLVCIFGLLFQFYKLHQVKIERSYYVSGIDGQIVNPNIDEEKHQKIVKALNQYYSERDAAQKAQSNPNNQQSIQNKPVSTVQNQDAKNPENNNQNTNANTNTNGAGQ